LDVFLPHHHKETEPGFPVLSPQVTEALEILRAHHHQGKLHSQHLQRTLPRVFLELTTLPFPVCALLFLISMSGSRRFFNVIIQLVAQHPDFSTNACFSEALTLRFALFSPDFWFFFCCVGFCTSPLSTNRQKLLPYCPSRGYAFDFDENVFS
jgi:hypothetical protein